MYLLLILLGDLVGSNNHDRSNERDGYTRNELIADELFIRDIII